VQQKEGERQRRQQKEVLPLQNNEKLCVELSFRNARFITLKVLKEVSHGMDTSVNESLTNKIVWHAPKNKVHSSSESLKNCISFALGIVSLGPLPFHIESFDLLGIGMMDDVRPSCHPTINTTGIEN